MIVRAIDGNNDWLFGKGKNDYKTGRDAVAQRIKTRLQSFLGDCFFDVNAGVDWFNLLGGKDLLTLRLSVSTIILDTEGVKSLVRLNSNLNNERNINLQYTVDTNFGQFQDKLEGVLGA